MIVVCVGAVSYWIELNRDPDTSSYTTQDWLDAKSERVDHAAATHGKLRSAWDIVSKEHVQSEELPQHQSNFNDAMLVRLDPEIWTWQQGERVAL